MNSSGSESQTQAFPPDTLFTFAALREKNSFPRSSSIFVHLKLKKKPFRQHKITPSQKKKGITFQILDLMHI